MALTTPKRTPTMKKLLKLVEENPAVVLRRDTTAANAGNLDPEYLSMIYGLFGGTRLSRQELDGEMLEDVEGALWKQSTLDLDRVETIPYLPMVYIIAVDPSVAEEPTDECGILVCAATIEQDLYRRHFYIVEDATVLGSPRIWANQVVAKAREYGCPVVAEVNQGGALVRDALQNIDPTVKVLDVRARYGKQTRAEPVSLAFEQHRGHMVGWWPDLESQLTSWTPADRKSPDRLDAMVWGATSLLIKPPPGLYTAPIRAHSAARLHIPRRPTPSAVPSQMTSIDSITGKTGITGLTGFGRRARARVTPRFRVVGPP
jgi:phage terminase large subunit-like protein